MMLRGKSLEEVTEADLQQLVEEEHSERKVIEYKREVHLDTPDQKREFLADVSSFANAVGGNLLFGIGEQGGIPNEVCGFEAGNVDDLKQTMENLFRSSIQPRLIGVEVVPVQLGNKKHVIIVGVPRSWRPPHRVTFRGHDKFYSRNSSGKYPLDVSELRFAFELSASFGEQARSFHMDRMGRIMAGDAPVPLPRCAKAVLHVIPFGAFASSAGVDVRAGEAHEDLLRPMSGGMNRSRFTFDGLLVWDAPARDLPTEAYTLLFRSGCIEAVDASLYQGDGEHPFIPGASFERSIVEATTRFLKVQTELGNQPPYLLVLGMAHARGYKMAFSGRTRSNWGGKIDRDVLSALEAVVADPADDVARLLHPAFNAIWNACGHPCSMCYENDGEWKLRGNKSSPR